MVTLPLLLALACHPPIDINSAPQVSIDSPGTDGETYNEGSGFAVVASVNDRDGDALTVELSSSAQGVLDTQEASPGTQVSLSTEGLGQGDHVLVVSASDGTLSGSDQVQVHINGAPSIPWPSINPSDPDTTDDLVGNIQTDAVDPEAGLIDYDWWWSKEGETQIHTDSDGTWPHLLSADLTAKGEVWVFTIEATEAEGADPISVEGTASVTILNAAPGTPVVEISPAEPTPLSSLGCEVTVEAGDADGDTVSYAVEWRIGGVLVEDETDWVLPSSYTSTGDTVQCTVTASDEETTGGSGSDSVSVGSPLVDLSAAKLVITGSQAGNQVGSYATGLMLNPTDGIDDLAVGAPAYQSGQGLLAVFQGGGLRDNDLNARRYGVVASSGWRLGGPLLAIGDTGGDGHDDLLVAALGTSGSADSRVLVLPGRAFSTPGNLDPTAASFPGIALTQQDDLGGFGEVLAGGDLDADGLADVVITHAPASGDNTVYLFTAIDLAGASGSPEVLTTAAADAISGLATGDGFGMATSAGGDLDGDGQDDLVITAPGRSGAFGWGFFDAVGSTSVADSDLAVSHSSTAGVPGTQALILPDIDDGYDELVLTSPWEPFSGNDAGLVALFTGAATWSNTLDLGDADRWIYSAQDDTAFGEILVSLGDVDGDGVPDLAVGAPDATAGGFRDAGQVLIFTGATLAAGTGMSSTDADLIIGGTEASAHVVPSGAAGDLDDDGLDDILVGFPGYDTSAGSNAGGLFVFLSGG